MILKNRLAMISFLAMASFAGLAQAEDWPQWLGMQRDGVWRERGILEKFPAEWLKARWRTPIGAGYSGPAIAAGKVYITDRFLATGASNPANAFGRSRVSGNERVLCLDEASGKILWKHEHDCPYEVSYAAGPRTTPVVQGDRVYTLGTMGDLLCLDTANGNPIWSRNFPKDYEASTPLWGFSAHPILDGDRLITLVGGQGSAVVAFHKDTGKEVWRALSAKEVGYAPPMIHEIGGVRQLIIWLPDSINSLNPETGRPYWSVPFGSKKGPLKSNLSIPTPRVANDRLFVTAFYDGPLMLKLQGTEKPTILWRGKGRGEQPDDTDGLHSIMSTPFLQDGHIYGVCSYGELRCLKADTGERLWSTHQATTGKSLRWGNAFLVAHEDRFFLFTEQGDLLLARLTPRGYEELSRTNILVPTNTMAPPPGRRVIWSHPAFANGCVFARNDREIACISLAVKDYSGK